jgi:poly(3-hydroxybutyrate) depolymerase
MFKKNPLKFLITLLVMLFSFNSTALADDASRLSGYGADLTKTSVSGLSSGAFMTSQFHVAYSDKLIGAGIVAGGPFYCVGSYEKDPSKFLQAATGNCLTPATAFVAPDGKGLYNKATKFAKDNKIADVNNLKDDKVYIFSGSNDPVVKTISVDQVEKFYQAAGLAPEQIKYDKTVPAGHALIVKDSDVGCSETRAPYINDCDFNQSQRILEHIYGKLNSPADTPSGKIVKFDQSEFIPAKNTSMSKDAYVYVPKSCETETCKVHVAIHGCEQGAKVIGDDYYGLTGYNEMADTNNFLILYPQVEPSNATPYNPKGCWDFWGYSSLDPANPVFYTRESPQMKAIVGMIDRLGQPRK